MHREIEGKRDRLESIIGGGAPSRRTVCQPLSILACRSYCHGIFLLRFRLDPVDNRDRGKGGRGELKWEQLTERYETHTVQTARPQIFP